MAHIFAHNSKLIWPQRTLFSHVGTHNMLASGIVGAKAKLCSHVLGVSKKYDVENCNIWRMVQYIDVILWDMVPATSI